MFFDDNSPTHVTTLSVRESSLNAKVCVFILTACVCRLYRQVERCILELGYASLEGEGRHKYYCKQKSRLLISFAKSTKRV